MIVLTNADKNFGAKAILDKVNQSINPAHRTGLVGPNGAGKTVLLRLIVGQDGLSGGTITMPPDLRIGYLPQELDLPQEVTPLELVLKPFSHLLDHDQAVDGLLHQGVFGDERQVMKALDQLDKLLTQRHIQNADALAAKGKSIMYGLGVPQESWELPLSRLSGGYRMRVVLAQLLLLEPDFLVLDEPTNHLDMDSLVWLERFLQKFRGGMLVVSHDRDFLARTTTHTAELERGELGVFKGSVTEYLAWKEKRDETDERSAKALRSQIAQTERFIERFRAKNTKATQAKSKMKQLEKLYDALPDDRVEGPTLTFRLPEPERCGAVPLTIRNIRVSYGDAPIFRNLSLTVAKGDKIAVIGPNGAGKSTLLKVCAGLLAPEAGEVSIGHNAQIRYYSQHRLDQLNPARTVYETIADITGSVDRNYIQSVLGAFFFSGDDVLKPAGVLSGGEKSRLSLATMLAKPGNVLLLDEPTNHLDIYSVRALADMLKEFAGAIMVVSHDEYFISHIATRLVEIRPGAIRDFPGTPAEYRDYLEAGYLKPLEDVKTSTTAAQQDQEDSRAERIRRREEKTRLDRKVEKLERAINEVEAKIATAQAVLEDQANIANYTLLADTARQIEALRRQNDELTEQWSAVGEELEGLAQVTAPQM